jgi:hypothetical protein
VRANIREKGLARIAGSLVITPTVTGCASELAAATATSTPKLDMAGRWILTTPAYGMNFESTPGEKHGAIEPEGGCPGKFFKSRHWQLAEARLTINDLENELFARLELVDDQFQGQSTTGMPMTLKR